MSIEIKIPKTITSGNLTTVLSGLETEFSNAIEHDEVIFDFRGCDYLSPTGAIYLILWKDFLKSKNIITKLIPSKKSVIGFLSALGVIDNVPFEKKFYKEYAVKLTECMSVDECNVAQSTIIRKVDGKCLFNKDTIAAIDYMLNELWDNAGVHGYSCYKKREYPKPVYMAAFVYSDRVEIAIADNGQGIHNSLIKNSLYKKISKKDALIEAIKNGVSGHPEGSPGFGLYSSSEFIRLGKGSLNIWSSGHCLSLNQNNIKIKSCSFNLGTIVCFTIYKTSTIPFGDVLVGRCASEYVDEVMSGIFV